MPRPPRNFARPKNFKKTFGRMMKYIKSYLPMLIIALVLATMVTVITIVGPRIIQQITSAIEDNLGGTIPVKRIVKLCTILAALYIFGAVISYVSGYLMTTVTNAMAKSLRKDISRKINVLPLSYLDHTSHGDMLSRLTNDVDTISQNLNNSIVTLVTGTLQVVGALVMMFISQYIMAFASIGSSLLGFLLSGLVMKFAQRHFIAQQKNLGRLNGHVEEVYGGHIIIKAYNGEKQVTEQFDKINKDLYKSSWKSQFMGGVMQPIMNFVSNLGYVIVCVVGGVLVVNGTIDFSVIVAFMMYINLFSSPLNQMAQVMTQLQSAVAASERVFEVLDAPELESEESKNTRIENCQGNVEFRNVHFGYSKDKPIINDFSCKIKAGQKVAIVGPTGAGKTTLVNLLMRFYEVDSGQILIDGVDTKDITRENLHDQFSMVLQDTWVYNASVKDNIIYSKPNVTDDEVKAAAKAVGLHHFIKTLPNGYDTILDENTTISAGQKQLLTIARAMVQNSPMLILDEATSSVDTRLELLIQKAMDKLTEHRTSFVIAHRLSTIKNADLILVMNKGDIVESGTHESLLKQGGFYAQLYNSQFEEAED